MTKTITVGYDGSANSYSAAKWAAREAMLLGADLVLVTSYQDVQAAIAAGYAYAGVEMREGVASVESDLRDLVTALRVAYPRIFISAKVCAGPAASVLARAADGDTLVVVGANDKSGLMEQLMGNTARTVARRSKCPVVVVKGVAVDARPIRVVVGVDESEHARAALHWAADEADLQDAPLVVVHAWSYTYSDLTDRVQDHDIARVDAERVLDAAVEAARERCGQSVTGELVENRPAAGILGVTRDGDLLVLGSRGRSATASKVLGSTVTRTLDTVSVPVVVVHGQAT